VARPAPLDGPGPGVVSLSPASKVLATIWGAHWREVAASPPIAASDQPAGAVASMRNRRRSRPRAARWRPAQEGTA